MMDRILIPLTGKVAQQFLRNIKETPTIDSKTLEQCGNISKLIRKGD